ncbi:MAG: glycine oxidase ThiO [Longimicrobiales bacterium]|nr:glycine oxidase ThiO [Longimicrobiales bacterium]
MIGGGLIGCSIAHALAVRGCATLLVERDTPARHATWAAGGMLSPLSEGLSPGPFLDMGLESLRRYPGWIRSLREASGRPVEMVESGKLEVAFTEDEARALVNEERSRPEGKPGGAWLSADRVLSREPALSPEVRGGLLFEDEAQVDNRLLGRAAAEAARAVGAEVRSGVPVRSVLELSGRAGGVELEDGTRIPAGAVVVAAGAWSGGIEGLPRSLPVRPVRGQMLSLDMGSMGSRPLSTVVETSRAYLIPRRRGPLVVGSTMEEVGFNAETTEDAIDDLLDAAGSALPGLRGQPPTETWAGLRPGTPDDLPILGEDPEMLDLYYATGHFRNGILLAPATAASVAALVLEDESPPVDLTAFRPDRFSSSVPVGS